MANALYPTFKQRLLGADIELENDTIKVALIDTGTYTYSAAHEFWSSASTALVGTAGTLGTKTIALGVFDAADVTFTGVTGSSVEALIIYKDTGVAGTSPLIAYIDTVASGLPVTPNSGNIDVAWDSGASRIFSL